MSTSKKRQKVKIGAFPWNRGGNELRDALVLLNYALDDMDSIDGKVDKEEGKGLSSNDFTDELLKKLSDLPKAEDLPTSTNDFTDFYKDSIEELINSPRPGKVISAYDIMYTKEVSNTISSTERNIGDFEYTNVPVSERKLLIKVWSEKSKFFGINFIKLVKVS